MKRTMAVAAVLLAALLAPIAARADYTVDRFFLDSKFCDQRSQFKGGPITADGPGSQVGVHTQVFAPAYARACRSGSGMVTYLGTADLAGLTAILERDSRRHFGTADVPFSTTEWVQAVTDQRAPDRRGRNSLVHQVPLFVDVQAIGYNLTSCSASTLNLRSQVLSAIYSGQVTRWNHELLVADNPDLARCPYPIRVIKRADVAGSTLTFKDYLSRRNPQWSVYRQPSQNQSWPTVTNACPALGEDGMAECILTTPNSIGYIQYRAAKVNRVRTARVDSAASAADPNPARRFVAPSAAACTEAAESAFVPPPVDSVSVLFYTSPQVSGTMLDWSAVSLTDAPRGYPICAFGYGLIYQNMQTAYIGQSYPPQQARTALDYLWTAVGDDAQRRLTAFDYGALPLGIRDVSRAGLSTVRYQG